MNSHKPNSLISILQREVMTRGYVSYDDACAIARKNGYRISNMERRLRPSDSPMIEEVKDEKGKYVIGYKVRKQFPIVQNIIQMLHKDREDKKVEVGARSLF